MGANIGDIFFKLAADASGLTAQATNEGTKAGDSASAAFASQFKKGIAQGLGIGGGLGIEKFVADAVRDVKQFFSESVQAALDLEASTARLNASLAANVDNWNGDTAAIDNAISARKELGFTDTDLQQSMAFLVGATHNVNQSLDVQRVAMDLARFKNIDLQSATEALVKVEAGRYRLLQSLGINIKANATSQEALTAVEKVAAGQAEAFGNTAAGAMAKFDEKVHSLQEDIGKLLIPVIDDLLTVGENAGDLFSRMADLAGKGIAEIRTSGQASAISGAQGDDLAKAIGAIEKAALPMARQMVFGRDAIELFGNGAGKASSVTADLVRNALSLANAQKILGGTMIGDSVFFRQFTTDAGETGAGLDNVAGKARAAAAGLDTTVHAGRGSAVAATTVAKAWQNAAKETGAGLDNILNAAVAHAQSLLPIVRTMASMTADEFAAQQHRTYEEALTQDANVAKGLRDGRSQVDQALQQLVLDQKNAHMLGAEAGLLGGILGSKGLAEGLASGIPTVAGDAAALALATETQLQQLPGWANALGLDVADALAKGIAKIKSSTAPPLDGLNTSLLRTQIQASSGWKIGQGEGSPSDFVKILKDMGVAIPPIGTDLSGVTKQFDALIGSGSSGGGSGAKGANQATKDLAAVAKTDLQAAFTKAKDTATALFDAIRQKSIAAATTVHTNAIQAIKDEHDQAYATAERTAAEEKYLWAKQKEALFAGVNQEQSDFNAHLAAEQLSSLQQQVSDASAALAANQDPTQVEQLTRAYNDAVQSLQDFNRQQQITADQAAAQKAADALDASHIVDPVTGLTDIDKAEADAKAQADTIAATNTAARDADLANAKKAADDLYNQDVKAFGDQLTLLEKHLTETKGSHAKAIADINALYVKAGLDAKTNGVNIGKGLADGLTSQVTAVEKGAESLANAVKKYIKVGSPAEAGPLHDNPPDVMGAKIGSEIGDNINSSLAATIPTFSQILAAFVAQGSVAAGQAVWTVGGGSSGTSPFAGPSDTAPQPAAQFYDTNGNPITSPDQIDALNGVFYDATGTMYKGNGYGTPNYQPDLGYATSPWDSMTGRMVGAQAAPASGNRTLNITVHNPRPEPASRSTDKSLRLVAAGAYK